MGLTTESWAEHVPVEGSIFRFPAYKRIERENDGSAELAPVHVVSILLRHDGSKSTILIKEMPWCELKETGHCKGAKRLHG
jgi:hypothetical protein